MMLVAYLLGDRLVNAGQTKNALLRIDKSMLSKFETCFGQA